MKVLLISVLSFLSVSLYGQNTKNSFVATINGIEGKGVIQMQKKQFKNAIIGFRSEGDNATVKNVISFTLKIPGFKSETIEGNKIDERMYQKILKNASKGDMITFFDIKTEHNTEPCAPMCYLSPPLVIEIY